MAHQLLELSEPSQREVLTDHMGHPAGKAETSLSNLQALPGGPLLMTVQERAILRHDWHKVTELPFLPSSCVRGRLAKLSQGKHGD